MAGAKGVPIMRKKRRLPILVIGPSIAYVPLTKGMVALIDSDDVEKVSPYNWNAGGSKRHFYAATGGIRLTARMHAFIAGTPPGMVTDHRNMNTMDNRRVNLHVCTQKENVSKMSVQYRSTTGLRGVYWNHSLKKYQATFYFSGHRQYCGVFLDPNEAYAVKENMRDSYISSHYAEKK